MHVCMSHSHASHNHFWSRHMASPTNYAHTLQYLRPKSFLARLRYMSIIICPFNVSVDWWTGPHTHPLITAVFTANHCESHDHDHQWTDYAMV